MLCVRWCACAPARAAEALGTRKSSPRSASASDRATQVHKARAKDTGDIVAVKIMELERAGAVPAEVQKEIDFMRSCDHENVIKFHAAYVLAAITYMT